MKKLMAVITILAVAALGTVVYAHDTGGWGRGHMMGQGYGGHMMGQGYDGHMMGPWRGGYGGHMMGRGYGGHMMGQGYGGHMMGPWRGGYGGHMMGQGYGGHMMGPWRGGYGGHMMGQGYGCSIQGTGYGTTGLSGYGTDTKFLNETADLRRELHNKRFDLFEAQRDPKTTAETITKMQKEMQEMMEKIYGKTTTQSPMNAPGMRGYGMHGGMMH